MDAPVELRKLHYFVAVGEELHFGRAAARLHMSQSPLSRAIRELERELGVLLFIRTTRRVELTPAGSALLVRTRRALAEIELAVDEARGAGVAAHAEAGIGYGPFSRAVAERISEAVADRHPERTVRLEEDVSPELLRRVAAHELAMAAVFRTPGAARRHGVRIDALRDEPLLAALPETHRFAGAEAIPIGAFAAECVLLPREPTGAAFNVWLRAVMRAAGFELGRTRETLSAPWDRRMLPVADGEAVSAIVGDWSQQAGARVVAVPFDPPITFPLDLASSAEASGRADPLVRAALDLRDDEGWLTTRSAHTEGPED
ncbi:MAG TPA: LysR family transcriptional regulator [Solirubrobacteraceae bacterium]|nr:LysR family transcriptional regulator [Solirubrobacteraceae bacterium]